MAARTVVQPYPRIEDESSKEHGMLDVSQLVNHQKRFTADEMAQMIRDSIRKANQKSSRAVIKIPENASETEIVKVYKREGVELFKYFKKYYGDPASTAHQVRQKHYREVAIEQFRNRTLQRGRMNSGWRYQFLLLDCAMHSNRFKSVSDLGAEEADFNATIEFAQSRTKPLSLYVSVKNRRNTMGGQDWPKAIRALETVAKTDKNRTGPYCCVFGITMDRGSRHIKIQQKTKQPHSVNTEVWLSDFLWPFFANHAYEEIMAFVLDVLLATEESDDLSSQIEMPEAIIESFGASCRQANLVDEDGYFHDPHKLVKFFCS